MSPAIVFGVLLGGLALLVAVYAMQRQPAVRERLARLEGEIQQLESQLHDMNDTRDFLLTTLREQSKKLADQADRIRGLEIEVSRLSMQLAAGREENERLLQQNSWLQDQLRKVKAVP